MFDLSPAVSPSGKTVAVASFQSKSWNGDIENLKTDIYVMNVDRDQCQGLGRKLIIKNGGWPSWGSDDIIFFHRLTSILLSSMIETFWAVFRYDINTEETVQVTSGGLDALTPAAISETKVAVVTIRQEHKFSNVRVQAYYRHIEIFDMDVPGLPSVHITQKMRQKGDHYNPFVLDGGGRIGYHRCRSESDLVLHGDDVPQNLHRLESPMRDVSLLRVSGMFPSISKDGSKLAFVDSEFKAVFVADSQGLRIIYEERSRNCVFSPVWNQNLDKDILYVCIGTSLNSHQLQIFAICNASGPAAGIKAIKLTIGGYNNAYPSSNPDGDKFVFRSTRDGLAPHKNLYIMLHSDNEQFREHSNRRHRDNEEFDEPWQTRLTKGKWTDTHCQWSPNGDWIVFSSTRDNRLDPRHFSVYLVKAFDPTVLIRVTSTGGDLGGQISHPVFSLDGRSIAVTVHLVAVSVDPVSLPNFKHGVRHYSDIFVVDVHPGDVEKKMKIKMKLKNKMETRNEKLMGFRFRRITHSRYECGTPAWTRAFATTDTNALWNMLPDMEHIYALGVSNIVRKPLTINC